METGELKNALEALLFITDRPLTGAELCKLTQVKDVQQVEGLVADLRRELDDKGSALQVMEVANGFQMATRAQYAPFIRRLFTDRMTMRLSAASLETLAIIAYRQPITRAEVEEVRGVEVIASLETLMEKGLVRVVGRKETVGRPLEYGTTPDFLRHFGLRSVEDLPSIESLAPMPTPGTPSGEKTTDDAPVPASEPVPAGEAPLEAPESGTAEAADPACAPMPDAPTSDNEDPPGRG